MADFADLASDTTETYLQIHLQQREANRVTLQPKGICHHCYAPVNNQQLFCDCDCEQDYAQEQKHKALNSARYPHLITSQV